MSGNETNIHWMNLSYCIYPLSLGVNPFINFLVSLGFVSMGNGSGQ